MGWRRDEAKFLERNRFPSHGTVALAWSDDHPPSTCSHFAHPALQSVVFPDVVPSYYNNCYDMIMYMFPNCHW